MKKIAFIAAAAAVAFAAPAMAQDAPQVGAYIGASAGYHDLGIKDDLRSVGITNPKDGGFIYGVTGGFDIPVGDQGVTLGLEGNYHLGSEAIDSDYGIATKLGFRTGATKLFVKGGYQWVNLDINKMTGGQLTEAQFKALGQSDTVDDYLVGVGAEINVGPRSVLTAGVDTVSFDTVRGTVGLGFKF
jgi:outer membrane immunogenic protein